MSRHVVGTEWGQFAIDPYEGNVLVFTDITAARLVADDNNKHGMIPDPEGDGLILAMAWKVYELIKVELWDRRDARTVARGKATTRGVGITPAEGLGAGVEGRNRKSPAPVRGVVVQAREAAGVTAPVAEVQGRC